MTNLESVQGLYEAFAKGDVPTVLGFLDANIAWTEAEGFPYGGTYNGPDAVLAEVTGWTLSQHSFGSFPEQSQ